MPAFIVDLTSNETGLIWSAVWCTAAAWLCFMGATRGLIQHRFPRILLSVAVAVIAASYWVDLADWLGAIDMRRGAGWLLWPSLAWTAWSGVKYSRRVVAESQAIIDDYNGNGG